MGPPEPVSVLAQAGPVRETAAPAMAPSKANRRDAGAGGWEKVAGLWKQTKRAATPTATTAAER
eukprot:CAMPEP_0115442908 /NCGR_PEP_ID=MMETSP0271-20121206/37590_1 /TAXON_ID=71861 /ORGANISM="Scrippsiella trochoidea, Strain CCMP3099" /LENGTH=63 /DNA_ID=CAMNT_0002868757 /DNA_START=62 /DNA_END=249 /DNA_ORIENTATION=-